MLATGTFNADDAQPDPVAMERLAMSGMISAASAALQIAAANLRRIAQLEAQAGTISERSLTLVSEQSGAIDDLAAALTETAALFEG
jgi:hypothetical protein